MIKSLLKKTFSAKRIYLATKFSGIVGLTYWATTIYENAFTEGSVISGIKAFLIVFLVLLLLAGSLLDTTSKD